MPDKKRQTRDSFLRWKGHQRGLPAVAAREGQNRSESQHILAEEEAQGIGKPSGRAILTVTTTTAGPNLNRFTNPTNASLGPRRHLVPEKGGGALPDCLVVPPSLPRDMRLTKGGQRGMLPVTHVSLGFQIRQFEGQRNSGFGVLGEL